MKKMLTFSMLLILCRYSSALPTKPSAAGISVDASRVKSEGVLALTIEGVPAEKIYHALAKAEEHEDQAMGGRKGTVRQGNGISCSLEVDAHNPGRTLCFIKLGVDGNLLAPGK